MAEKPLHPLESKAVLLQYRTVSLKKYESAAALSLRRAGNRAYPFGALPRFRLPLPSALSR